MKEAIPVQHVESDGLGAMGVGMAGTLLREKFIHRGADADEPTLVRCKKFRGFIGIVVQKL